LGTASSPFRFELDLEGAVVEKFRGSFAIDLVAFLAAGLESAEGDFAALRGDRQRRGEASSSFGNRARL